MQNSIVSCAPQVSGQKVRLRTLLPIALAALAFTACTSGGGGGGWAPEQATFEHAATTPTGDVATMTCSPQITNCDGLDHLLTCAADGQAWIRTACGDGRACEDGRCLAIRCQANATVCDGNAVIQCSARGTSWLAPANCAADKACVGGACLALQCSPSAIECSGTRLATCSDDGQGWSTVSCGAGSVCVAGFAGAATACQVQVCVPNAVRCAGGKVTSCDENGVVETVAVDCNVGDMACLGGACVAKICAPGAVTCEGSHVATCTADGTGWNSATCAAGSVCDAGSCAALTCVPDEVYCDGGQVAQCNALGTSNTTTKSCSGTDVCKQGSCTQKSIVCGDGVCEGKETLNSCVKDCLLTPTVSADLDKVSPKVGKTLPRTPRLLTKTAPAAWTAGQALAVYGLHLLVVDSDNGALVRMNRQTLQVEATIALGKRPEQVVVGPDGMAWVSLRDAGQVVRLSALADDLDKATFLQVGRDPMGLALTQDGKVLFVTLAGENALVSFDVETGKELARAAVGFRPRAVTLTPAGKAVVAFGRGQVQILPVGALVAPNPLTIETIPILTTGLRTIAATPTCESPTVFATRNANQALGTTVEPDSGDVLVVHVMVASGAVKDTLLSAGVKALPKTKQVTTCSGGYYGQTCTTTTVIIEDPPCVGLPLRPYDVAVSRLTAAGTLQPTTTSPAVIHGGTGLSFFSRFDQPVAIVHHPNLSLAFVVARGTDSLLVLNTAANDPMAWPLAEIHVGGGPRALAFSLDGGKAYVLNGTDFTISEVDLGPLTAFVTGALAVVNDPNKLQQVEPLSLEAAKASPYGQDPLSPQMQLGRKVFHNARNSRLSAVGRFACATCHLDGTEDGQVWFGPDGPRQTPSLAGRLADTAPYSWMGNVPSVNDYIQVTCGRMGGSGLLPEERDALELFVMNGLQQPPNPNVQPGGLTPQQAAGKAVYDDPSVGCAGCHGGAALTDGLVYDVGTANPVEVQVNAILTKAGLAPTPLLYATPSLRGLYHSAPYLHDGSAATLEAALAKTATTMGMTAQLSTEQRGDLIAYLLTL